MKISFTISLIQPWLSVALCVASMGCVEEPLLQPGLLSEPASHEAHQLLAYALRTATSDTTHLEQPWAEQVATLLQTAPMGENDTAYWQWYHQTLATTCATTEYHRGTDGTILLAWDFSATDCQHQEEPASGRMSLRIHQRDDRLILRMQTEAAVLGASQVSGRHQWIWQVYTRLVPADTPFHSD